MQRVVFSLEKYLRNEFDTRLYLYDKCNHGTMAEHIEYMYREISNKDLFPANADGKEWKEVAVDESQLNNQYLIDKWCEVIEVPDYEVSD